MKTYSSFEWILIEIGTQWGLDKETFDVRLKWAKEHINELELLGDSKEWKEKPLFIKAVMALRDALAGKPINLMVALDSSASGMQLMSALTGCVAGAEATGLINPDVRADVYTAATKVINELLGTSNSIPRADMKQALMTSLYGSKAEPKKLFGEDTPELAAFYKAAKTIAPGAWELLQDLLDAWQPYAKKHEWTVADGFEAKVKVMVKEDCRIEVDELNSSFSYIYYENQGTKKGISLAANVIHSQDALVVREMHRRVNYDTSMVTAAYEAINRALLVEESNVLKLAKYKALYKASGFASVVVLPLITEDATGLSKAHLKALKRTCEAMLGRKPAPLVTIHDSFATLPRAVDTLRYHYRDIVAEMADSTILSHVFSQLMGQEVTYTKLSNDLSEKIRKSAYGIC